MSGVFESHCTDLQMREMQVKSNETSSYGACSVEPLANFENRIYQGMEYLVPPRETWCKNTRASKEFGSGTAVECHFDDKKDLVKKYWFTKKLC